MPLLYPIGERGKNSVKKWQKKIGTLPRVVSPEPHCQTAPPPYPTGNSNDPPPMQANFPLAQGRQSITSLGCGHNLHRAVSETRIVSRCGGSMMVCRMLSKSNTAYVAHSLKVCTPTFLVRRRVVFECDCGLFAIHGPMQGGSSGYFRTHLSTSKSKTLLAHRFK